MKTIIGCIQNLNSRALTTTQKLNLHLSLYFIPASLSIWMRCGCIRCSQKPWQTSALRLIFLHQLAAYHQPLDLTCALVDLRDASVAVVPLCGHVCHVAHPTQNLDRLRRQIKPPFKGFIQLFFLNCVCCRFPTWCEQNVAASDAVSLAMAASCRTTRLEVESWTWNHVDFTATEVIAYLSEGFLSVSKKSSLPGEQSSAL